MTQQDKKLMRLEDIKELTGFKRSFIYNLMREGKFPRPIKIGNRIVGWDSRVVTRWFDDLFEEQV